MNLALIGSPRNLSMSNEIIDYYVVIYVNIESDIKAFPY